MYDYYDKLIKVNRDAHALHEFVQVYFRFQNRPFFYVHVIHYALRDFRVDNLCMALESVQTINFGFYHVIQRIPHTFAPAFGACIGLMRRELGKPQPSRHLPACLELLLLRLVSEKGRYVGMLLVCTWMLC